MKSLSDSQIEKMIQDIALIKDVLAKSQPSMELLFLPVHFRIVFLLSGISVIVFSAVFYLLMEGYGSFHNIPELYRNITFGLMLVVALILGILKNINWIHSLSLINPQYNFRKAYREFFSIKILHSYGAIVLSMFIFFFFWIITGRPYFILPTMCIGIGILGNAIGSMADLIEYTVFGCWTLIWGFIIVIASSIPAPIAIGASMGLGMVIFAVMSYIRNSCRGE